MDFLLPIEQLHKCLDDAKTLGDLGRVWNRTWADRREVSVAEQIELIEACVGHMISLAHAQQKK